MKRSCDTSGWASVLAAIAAVGGCGSTPPVIANEHAAPEPPAAVTVLFDAGAGRFSPLLCLRDGALTGDCARVTATIPQEAWTLRDPGGHRWRITGTEVDGCGYQVEQLTAIPDGHVPDADDRGRDGLAVIPADAAIAYREAPPPADAQIAVDAETASALAQLASLYLDREVDPDEVHVAEQMTDDFDGDGLRDRLYVATAAATGDDSPGGWRSIVFVPHGRTDAAVDIVPDDRSFDELVGSFDLDGDGRREVYFIRSDGDGDSAGVISFVDGAPVLVATVNRC